MKMKRLFRALSLMLCLCLLLGGIVSPPARGAEDGGEAKPAPGNKAEVVKLSGDYGHGYCTVFRCNGREYRSDLMGPEVNYKLWLLCSDEDRYEILKNYCFAFGEQKAQFGEENALNMNKWYKVYSGWEDAWNKLGDRIARRDFQKISYFYLGADGDGDGGDSWFYNRAKVAEDGADEVFERYLFLPEVREYRELHNSMEVLYDCGATAFQTLREAKLRQTQIAVTTISAGLISLIVERVMVPAISPGGLSALVPEAKGEIIGLIDKLTGLSEKLNATFVGETPDPKQARAWIEAYWEVIEVNEQLANHCVDEFMSLKSKKQKAFEAANAAIQTFQEEGKAQAEAAGEAAAKASEASTGAVTPPGSDVGEVYAYYQELLSQFGDDFYGDLTTTEDSLSTRLNEIRFYYEENGNQKDNLLRYNDGWPHMEYVPGTNFQYYNMDELRSDSYPVWYFTACYNSWWTYLDDDGVLRSRYSVLKDEIPDTLRAAISEAKGDESALSAYRTDYESELERLNSKWLSYKAKFEGVNNRLISLGSGEIQIPSVSSDMAFFVSRCGSLSLPQTGVEIPLEQAQEELAAYTSKLETVLENFETDSAVMESEVRAMAADYREQQQTIIDVSARYPKVFEEYNALVAETEGLYFDGKRTVNGQTWGAPKLSDELEALDTGPEQQRRAQYAKWAADLTERVEKLHALAREKEELEEDRTNALQICYDLSHYGASLEIMNDLSGGGLYAHDRLQALWWDSAALSDDGSGGAVLMDTQAFVSDANVLRACQEFTGMNALSVAVDEAAAEVKTWKGNYMRAGEEERKDMEQKAGALVRSPHDRSEFYNYYSYARVLTYPTSYEIYNLFHAWEEGSWEQELSSGSYVPVTGLEGSGGALTLAVGDTLKLGSKVQVLPINASDPGLIWESSDGLVCAVDEDGTLSARDYGAAVITCRAADSAWTEDEAGTRTYSPAPLRYTVTVGGGEAPGEVELDNITWRNYGTDSAPAVYQLRETSAGTVVECAADWTALGQYHIALTLRDATGKMLDAALLAYQPAEAGFSPAVLHAGSASGNLRLRAFVLSADGGFIPYDGGFPLDEVIPR